MLNFCYKMATLVKYICFEHTSVNQHVSFFPFVSFLLYAKWNNMVLRLIILFGLVLLAPSCYSISRNCVPLSLYCWVVLASFISITSISLNLQISTMFVLDSDLTQNFLYIVGLESYYLILLHFLVMDIYSHF